jgi:hypothetical protein
MARPRKKTVGVAIQEVREMQERIAVTRALSSYIRTRYLPRDAQPVPVRLPCQGSYVSEAMLEEVAQELEESATNLEKTIKTYEQQEFDE